MRLNHNCCGCGDPLDDTVIESPLGSFHARCLYRAEQEKCPECDRLMPVPGECDFCTIKKSCPGCGTAGGEIIDNVQGWARSCCSCLCFWGYDDPRRDGSSWSRRGILWRHSFAEMRAFTGHLERKLCG